MLSHPLWLTPSKCDYVQRPKTQRTPPYKNYYPIVSLLRIVNLLSRNDLLSRPPCANIMLLGNYRHFSSQRRVHNVVNIRVKHSKLCELKSHIRNRSFRIHGAKSPEILQKEWGFGLRNRSSKSQIASDFPLHPWIALLCDKIVLSQKSGSVMEIAIASRKNSCDFGARTPRTAPKIQQNMLRWHEHFSESSLLHCDMSQERIKNCSERTCSDDIFCFGGFLWMRLFCLQLEASAYSGAFSVTVDNFSFFAYSWSFFAYSFSFLTHSWSSFAHSGKVRLIRALRIVSKEA